MPLIPSKQSAELGQKFLKEIAAIDGDVFMPEVQFIQTRVGKKSYAYGMAAIDVFRANLGRSEYVKRDLGKSLADALQTRRFAAILSGHIVPVYGMGRFYAFARHLGYPKENFSGSINLPVIDIFYPVGAPVKP